MQLQSSAFHEGDKIPSKYTANGENISPELSWAGAPAGVKSFALVVEDPDAPGPQPWVHWVVYNIPGSITHLSEGDLVGTSGRNSWGRAGYGGPQPTRGSGVHHYRFTIYALQEDVDATHALTKEELLYALRGKVLSEATLVGTYENR